MVPLEEIERLEMLCEELRVFAFVDGVLSTIVVSTSCFRRFSTFSLLVAALSLVETGLEGVAKRGTGMV